MPQRLYAMVMAVGMAGSSLAMAEVPFPDALKDANVGLTSISNGQSESLMLGNGDLYGIVWEKDGGLFMRVTKNDVWDARVDTSKDGPLPRVDVRTGKVTGSTGAPPSYFILGARQSGKTSLLKRIARLYEDEKKEVHCHFLTLADASVAPAIGREFRLTDVDEATVLDYLRRESDGGARLFLLDESDQFVAAQVEQGYGVMREMRALSEEGIAHFILAGFWRLYETIAINYQSPLKNFGETLEIGPLDSKACHDLATVPMRGLGLSYAEQNMVDRLTEQSGGRANLIAIACNEMLKRVRPGDRQLSSEVFKKALDSPEIRVALSGWVRLQDEENNPTNQRLNRLDRLLVYTNIHDESFAMEDVLQRLEHLNLNYTSEEIQQAIVRLELAFVFGQDSGRYSFCVPLFRQMILEQSPDERLAIELRDART